jgi:putative addiction module antidote
VQHFTLKIIRIGNSRGVTLPKEALGALKAEKGDSLTLTSAPYGFRLAEWIRRHLKPAQ